MSHQLLPVLRKHFMSNSKSLLQNYYEILKKCFLDTTYTVMSLLGSNLDTQLLISITSFRYSRDVNITFHI